MSIAERVPWHEQLDAVVVGGGPAGLSAALWLARYNRRIRLYDAGEPRNRAARAVHGYPGLPGAAPDELRERIRRQAVEAGAEFAAGQVTAVTGAKDDFLVEAEGASAVRARRIVLAYGLRDRIPDIPGLAEAYGVTVHHCPDCDGPSIHEEPVGVIGWNRGAAKLALFLLTWTRRVTLLTDGRVPELDDEASSALHRHGVAVVRRAIARVDQHRGHVRGVVFHDGDRLPVSYIFFHIGTRPASDLGARLDCRMYADGCLVVDGGQETTTPGVYAAGDISGRPYLAITAAAQGVRAALALHRSLLPPDQDLRPLPA